MQHKANLNLSVRQHHRYNSLSGTVRQFLCHVCGLERCSDRWLHSGLGYWNGVVVADSDSGKLVGRRGALESPKG